ncbi:uncharacterized protein LOC6557263 [Drosophila grimshawi]|uniref:uncharacterized protein LOC6557263 n=1 Tax=Drosophila grimshawi TaxID=7222 RepID=UPI001C93688F|nr:uncharacterized protein LOC6557263 [Drosophila grimshawi]
MDEELNGEHLDRHFMQQVKEYETVFRTKACPSDQEIIMCWLRILTAAPESQKLARNCLMLLMYGHLNEIGYLQKPFTDMRNFGKDLNDILDSYKGLPVPSAVKSTKKEAETSKDEREIEKSFRDMYIVGKSQHKIMDSYKGLPLFKEDKSTQKDAVAGEAETIKDIRERDKHFRYMDIPGKNRKKILDNYKGLPLIKEDKSTQKHVAFCEAEIDNHVGEKDKPIKDMHIVGKHRYKIYDNYKILTLSKEDKSNQNDVVLDKAEAGKDLKEEQKRNNIEERTCNKTKGLPISTEDKSTQYYAAACEVCEKKKAFVVGKNRIDILDRSEEQPLINKDQCTQKDASTGTETLHECAKLWQEL